MDKIQQLMVAHGMPDGGAEIKLGSLVRTGDSAPFLPDLARLRAKYMHESRTMSEARRTERVGKG